MTTISVALVGQSKHPDTDFAIADWSVKVPFVGDWKAKVRTRIKQVDQVIVICGEHTRRATGAAGEVGKGSEWIAADHDSEDNGLGTCETNDVGISTKENRGISESTLG